MNPTFFERDTIYSPLALDPALAQIVAQFVGDLPSRVAAMQIALKQRNFEQVRSLAHQLKGAAGSYGFDELSQVSQRLELAIVDERPGDVVASALQGVADTVTRIRPGTA